MNSSAHIAACTRQGYIATYLCNALQWLDASQFGLRARHSRTPQGMQFRDHINSSFNNNFSTVAVFSDVLKPLTSYGTLVCYMTYWK